MKHPPLCVPLRGPHPIVVEIDPPVYPKPTQIGLIHAPLALQGAQARNWRSMDRKPIQSAVPACSGPCLVFPIFGPLLGTQEALLAGQPHVKVPDNPRLATDQICHPLATPQLFSLPDQ